MDRSNMSAEGRAFAETLDEFSEAAKEIRQRESRDRENRIEALRAASWIVAGMYAEDQDFVDNDGNITPAEDATLQVAEQFAKWLETGKR